MLSDNRADARRSRNWDEGVVSAMYMAVVCGSAHGYAVPTPWEVAIFTGERNENDHATAGDSRSRRSRRLVRYGEVKAWVLRHGQHGARLGHDDRPDGSSRQPFKAFSATSSSVKSVTVTGQLADAVLTNCRRHPAHDHQAGARIRSPELVDQLLRWARAGEDDPGVTARSSTASRRRAPDRACLKARGWEGLRFRPTSPRKLRRPPGRRGGADTRSRWPKPDIPPDTPTPRERFLLAQRRANAN
ncbi:hypothetical protein ShzoTeo12_53740 (plasmid) [Shinella zoogloeoides]|nr:hypothetical protein ShzoTeo12_53740 [Shinella zoogloeoides]